MNIRKLNLYLLALVGLMVIIQGAHFLHLGYEKSTTISYMVSGAMFSVLCLMLSEEDKNKGV